MCVEATLKHKSAITSWTGVTGFPVEIHMVFETAWCCKCFVALVACEFYRSMSCQVMYIPSSHFAKGTATVSLIAFIIIFPFLLYYTISFCIQFSSSSVFAEFMCTCYAFFCQLFLC